MAAWNSDQDGDGSASTAKTNVTTGAIVAGITASSNSPTDEVRPRNCAVNYIIKL